MAHTEYYVYSVFVCVDCEPNITLNTQRGIILTNMERRRLAPGYAFLCMQCKNIVAGESVPEEKLEKLKALAKFLKNKL